MDRRGTRDNPYEWTVARLMHQRQRQSRDKDRAEQRGPASGIGRGQAAASWKPDPSDQPAFSTRRAAEFAWAEQHLPAEHPGLVVSALIGMEVAGHKRSTQSVMARLESQERTMAQLREKGWA